MGKYKSAEVQFSVFLIWKVHAAECSAPRPGRSNLGERAPDTYQKGGWVGGPLGLSGHITEESNHFPPGNRNPRFLGHPASSLFITVAVQSLLSLLMLMMMMMTMTVAMKNGAAVYRPLRIHRALTFRQ
jgi:hypothetical protein